MIELVPDVGQKVHGTEKKGNDSLEVGDKEKIQTMGENINNDSGHFVLESE